MADRISNLPGDLIDHILSCLPVCDAARTTILSREWRDSWPSISSLTFNDTEFENRSWFGNFSPESIVHHTLLFHTGPVTKFVLRCPFKVTYLAICSWLKFLSSHPVQVLGLHLPDHGGPGFIVPRRVFSFDHLTRLSLSAVVIKTPPDFKGFNRLVSLRFNRCGIGFEELTRFLSKCPRIEFLKISCCCDTFGYLRINAPKLKTFKFRGEFCSIFLDAVGLEELSMEYFDLDLEDENVVESFRVEGNLMTTFAYLPSVTKLKITYPVMKFLIRYGIQQNQSSFKRLIDVHLCGDQFGEKRFVYAICLAIIFPNLQRLKISGEMPNIFNTSQPGLATLLRTLKAEHECKTLLPHLKILKVCGMSGSKFEMEFVRLIFLWANVLEKLVFRWSNWISPSSEERFHISEQLASFRRASSAAEIVIQ